MELRLPAEGVRHAGRHLLKDRFGDQHSKDTGYGVHAWENTGSVVTVLIQTHAGKEWGDRGGRVGETRGGVPEMWQGHAEQEPTPAPLGRPQHI